VVLEEDPAEAKSPELLLAGCWVNMDLLFSKFSGESVLINMHSSSTGRG
jgi:hypothetical protein